MNNNIIIALFIAFALIIFFNSLQTSSQTNTTVQNGKNVLQDMTGTPTSQLSVPTTQIMNPTQVPTAEPTQIPTLFPTPTLIPVQHPSYRVNVGEGSDD